MKRMTTALIGLLLFSLTAFAAPKGESLTGWISDSKCGVKGANSSHEACAKKCIAAGEKPVLVDDKDQKVVAIANPDSVKDEIGQHVAVSGSMTSGGELHVSKVKAAAQ